MGKNERTFSRMWKSRVVNQENDFTVNQNNHEASLSIIPEVIVEPKTTEKKKCVKCEKAIAQREKAQKFSSSRKGVELSRRVCEICGTEQSVRWKSCRFCGFEFNDEKRT